MSRQGTSRRTVGFPRADQKSSEGSDQRLELSPSRLGCAVVVQSLGCFCGGDRRVAAVAFNNGFGTGAVEAFLVTEVILQRRQADARCLRYSPRGHGLERGLAKRPQRRVENPLSRLFALLVAGVRDSASL